MSKAIFLGTFNPPHNGHVNCIKSVIRSGILNQFNIEKIHIIPCWQNPNKEDFDDPKLRFWQRYKMCTLEFAGLNDYCIIDESDSIFEGELIGPLIISKKFILLGDEGQVTLRSVPIEKHPATLFNRLKQINKKPTNKQ